MTYRPEDTKFDARERYADIHETIREHPLKSDRKVAVLCFEILRSAIAYLERNS